MIKRSSLLNFIIKNAKKVLMDPIEEDVGPHGSRMVTMKVHVL